MATAFDRLADLVRALAAERVEYVLFGGQAVNLHGIPRFTEDVDIVARIGEAFAFGDVEWESMTIGDSEVRIATPRMLYRMKKDTVRPVGHADAADLKDKFRLEDD